MAGVAGTDQTRTVRARSVRRGKAGGTRRCAERSRASRSDGRDEARQARHDVGWQGLGGPARRGKAGEGRHVRAWIDGAWRAGIGAAGKSWPGLD